MVTLMEPLDPCLPFMGNLLIVFYLIFSLLFNPAKVDHSAESKATEERSILHNSTLTLFVDA